MDSDKKGNVKKFVAVFAKRVAASARPTKCVDCECTGYDSGVSYMDCYPCTYPTRANIENVSKQILMATIKSLPSTARAAFCNPSVQQMVLLSSGIATKLPVATSHVSRPLSIQSRIYILTKFIRHFVVDPFSNYSFSTLYCSLWFFLLPVKKINFCSALDMTIIIVFQGFDEDEALFLMQPVDDVFSSNERRR